METSSVKKFTIRHESVAEGGEVDFTPYLTDYYNEDATVNRISYRTMKNKAVDFPVANMKKLYWTLNMVDTDIAETLFGSTIREKINTTGRNRFYVNAYIIGEGWKSGFFYLGNDVKFKRHGVMKDDGALPPYVDFELHWIEEQGVLLEEIGTPTEVPTT